MRITWDREAEAVYVYLDVPHKEHGSTRALNDSINLDYDMDGTLYGIEVLYTREPKVEDITRKEE